jgi:hypothetical protein
LVVQFAGAAEWHAATWLADEASSVAPGAAFEVDEESEERATEEDELGGRTAADSEEGYVSSESYPSTAHSEEGHGGETEDALLMVEAWFNLHLSRSEARS